MSPTIVRREVHGCVVPVKVYPPAPAARDESLLEEIERVLDELLFEIEAPPGATSSDC
jgi:hypothetical protein